MFLFLGASNGVAKMCQIKDCAICNAGQEFLKEEENQNKKDLDKVPSVCNGTKVTSDKEKYSVQNLPVCIKVNSDQNGKYSVQNPPLCMKVNSDQNGKYSVQNPPVCTKLTSDQKEKYSVQNPTVCTNGTSDQEEYSVQNPPENPPGNHSGNPPGNPTLCTELTSGQPHFSNSLARKDGITPLIMAAAMNHDLCVDLLLSAGVDPNEESKVGCLKKFRLLPPCMQSSSIRKYSAGPFGGLSGPR